MISKKTTVEERKGRYVKEATEEAKFYVQQMKKSPAFKSCTPRERLFAINYVLYQGDIAKTMVMSGSTSKYYSKIAHDILKKDRVQEAIRTFWELMFADKVDKVQKILLDQLYRRAFTPRYKYFDKDGKLKPGIELEDLGPDECIIDNIEVKYYGKDADVKVTTYKLADRAQAYKELRDLLKIDSLSNDQRRAETGVLKVPTVLSEEDWVKLD